MYAHMKAAVHVKYVHVGYLVRHLMCNRNKRANLLLLSEIPAAGLKSELRYPVPRLGYFLLHMLPSSIAEFLFFLFPLRVIPT
jgi:hypothetical protein